MGDPASLRGASGAGGSVPPEEVSKKQKTVPQQKTAQAFSKTIEEVGSNQGAAQLSVTIQKPGKKTFSSSTPVSSVSQKVGITHGSRSLEALDLAGLASPVKKAPLEEEQMSGLIKAIADNVGTPEQDTAVKEAMIFAMKNGFSHDLATALGVAGDGAEKFFNSAVKEAGIEIGSSEGNAAEQVLFEHQITHSAVNKEQFTQLCVKNGLNPNFQKAMTHVSGELSESKDVDTMKLLQSALHEGIKTYQNSTRMITLGLLFATATHNTAAAKSFLLTTSPSVAEAVASTSTNRFILSAYQEATKHALTEQATKVQERIDKAIERIEKYVQKGDSESIRSILFRHGFDDETLENIVQHLEERFGNDEQATKVIQSALDTEATMRDEAAAIHEMLASGNTTGLKNRLQQAAKDGSLESIHEQVRALAGHGELGKREWDSYMRAYQPLLPVFYQGQIEKTLHADLIRKMLASHDTKGLENKLLQAAKDGTLESVHEQILELAKNGKLSKKEWNTYQSYYQSVLSVYDEFQKEKTLPSSVLIDFRDLVDLDRLQGIMSDTLSHNNTIETLKGLGNSIRRPELAVALTRAIANSVTSNLLSNVSMDRVMEHMALAGRLGLLDDVLQYIEAKSTKEPATEKTRLELEARGDIDPKALFDLEDSITLRSFFSAYEPQVPPDKPPDLTA